MPIDFYDQFSDKMTKADLILWLERLNLSEMKRLAQHLAITPKRSVFQYADAIDDLKSREEIVSAVKNCIFNYYRDHFKFSTPAKKKQVLTYLSFLERSELRGLVRAIKASGIHLVLGTDRLHHIVEIRHCKIEYQSLYKLYKKNNLLPGNRQVKTNTKNRSQNKVQAKTDELEVTLLNTSVPLEHVLCDVEQFFQYMNANKAPLFHNYNLIFHGPPGTGKSMFAQTLAKSVGKPLITLSASDLLSQFVGETEEFIAGAFAEAQKKKAILFLDEMDAILGDREGATSSWERSQVNEFLVQMERFKGVFIAATNFPKVLDKALERRFAHKIKFDHLKPESLSRFFAFFFKIPLEANDLERLMRMHSLAAGDFKVALQRGFFRPNQNASLYLDELERINEGKKRKPIGLA